MRIATLACALALLLAMANGQAEAEAPAAAPETSAAAGAQAGVAAPAASPVAAAPAEQPAAVTSGQAVGFSPAATAPSAFGGTPAATPKVRNVLLISVDGLHSQDLSNFIAQEPGSTLASLVQSGVVYPNAYLPGPSDSYPGIVALTSGTNVTVSGVYYDDSYDRTLYPPGSCAQLRTGSPEGPAGTETAYTEAMDYNLYSIAGLNGTGTFNGPSTNVTTLQSDYPAGGFNGSALNESAMPVDQFCNPVHPYTFSKAESIFQIASSAGMTTAWVDKTPIYEIVQGSQGNGVTDLYTPEIACLCGNPQVQGAPDTSIVDGSGIDLAKNVTAVQQYDQTHVNAILNQINGTRSNGIGSLPSVPRLFGLNFQAVSVGQKYAGYTNASGGFSSGLLTTLNYVDRSIGTIYQALINRGLTPSTAIIITAKHGQQPIFPNATLVSPTPLAAALANANISVAQFTSDDLGLIWLNQQNQTTAAINTLRSLAANQSCGIQAVNTAGYYGLNSNVAGRTPDVVIVPLPGVVYSDPTAKLKKVSEHGGLMKADLNVALAVVLPPGSSAAGTTVNDTVNVQQVAATALSLLGLPLSSLSAGAANPLPGLGTSPASAAAPTAATLPLASSTASGAAAAAALAPAAPAAVSSAGALVAPAGANQANPATPAAPKPEAAG